MIEIGREAVGFGHEGELGDVCVAMRVYCVNGRFV